MDFNDYQTNSRKTANYPAIGHAVIYPTLGLVNEAGEVFVAAADTRLPRLSGPEDSSAEVVAAYRRHHAALAPLGMAIDELRLSPRRAWRLKLDNGMTLALGREQTDARLTRFVALYPRLFGAQAAASADALAAAPMTPVTVDLRYPDGFAVRMPDGVSPFKSSET